MHEHEPIDPADAALREWIASVAGFMDDPAKTAMLNDFLTVVRPVAEWTRPELDTLTETCNYVISLARMSRELHNLNVATS